MWQCDAPKKGGGFFPYFFASRGEDPPPSPTRKRPEAVVIVAITEEEEPRLVLTSEYRVPLGCREISFPAGLIDESDYISSEDESVVMSVRAAAMRAAIRELKEETGLDFTPTAVSPDNLYSSAGMTNESCIIIFGYASGTPSLDGNEASEDIRVMLTTFVDMVEMIDTNQGHVYSKVCWPFLWAFKFFGGYTKGFPTIESL
jgi:ADP-ribose pyrophosphatase